MRTLTIDIRVGQLRYKRVTSVEVNRNWRNLTQTASINFPRRAFINGQEVKVKDLIKIGDPVTIKAGYNGDNNLLFEGYLVRYNPNRPFSLECEDEMWKQKKGDINQVYPAGTTIKTLITATYSGPVVYLDPNIKLGQCELTHATPAQVYEELKRTYSIPCFFRCKTLVVGKQYNPDTQVKHTFYPDKNIIDKDSLVFRTKEETQYLITGISIKPDNSRITYKKGETGGDQYTRNYFNIDEATLKNNVDREYNLAVYSGWRGNFTGWGLPFVQVGDIAKLTNNYYPEFNGNYLIDGVTTKISKGGIRQIITPGPAASAVATA